MAQLYRRDVPDFTGPADADLLQVLWCPLDHPEEGGFANWSLTDPHPMDCVECGTAMTLLFTAASSEWHGTGGSWRPVEEPPGVSSVPTDVSIGRGYGLFVFRCPESYEHPPATAMQ
ncbi:hypothetical protein ACQEVZ_01300 [Dactylosporangium sp. CA-152071]|uniref:hypothetical protein n=1 Tax=Dactylosporangium sp. CA-152071 TaxID=3239933 RepID=UPI003D934A46